MKKTAILLSTSILTLMGATSWVVSQDTGSLAVKAPADADIGVGKALYGEFCASCHGENLEGQPNWRSPGEDGRLPAPPHDKTGHTWHHPDSMLFTYTKSGGKAALASQGVEFDSGMPGFSEELSDDEIWNVLAYIQSTWPERHRQIQSERTRFDNQREGN